ncbi:MAG TPA: BON domain-containing protein [Candidatus Limnocylindrales bacterium]|nr:BON domain-containing protein [Candidatus Limnocylindrales bacterium]
MYRPESRRNRRERFDEMQQQDEGQYGGQGDLTTADEQRSLDQPGGDWSRGRSRGNWTGYVVPYRYYGNGYAGVGYYSVLYQGQRDAGDTEQEQGRGQFDQREVDYGQGQGAGEAWTGRWGGRRRSAGGFTGRGPKGYQRSDQRLEEEISDRLMADAWVDASEIEVRVKSGEVTLTGTVDDRDAKRRAEDIAEQVMGVRDVMNQIRVESDGGRSRESSATRGSGSSGSSRRSTRNGGRSTDDQTTASGAGASGSSSRGNASGGSSR